VTAFANRKAWVKTLETIEEYLRNRFLSEQVFYKSYYSLLYNKIKLPEPLDIVDNKTLYY
jgi:hypothetical protein